MGFALIHNQHRQYNGGNQHFGNQCPQLYQKKAYSGYFMVSYTYSGLVNKSVGLKLKPAFLYVEHFTYRIFKKTFGHLTFSSPTTQNVFYNITCLEDTSSEVFVNNFVIEELMCKSDQMLPLLCRMRRELFNEKKIAIVVFV